MRNQPTSRRETDSNDHLLRADAIRAATNPRGIGAVNIANPQNSARQHYTRGQGRNRLPRRPSYKALVEVLRQIQFIAGNQQWPATTQIASIKQLAHDTLAAIEQGTPVR